MSRIGRREIPLPKGVQVEIDGQVIRVRGALGELTRILHPRIRAEHDGSVIKTLRSSDERQDRALHGLTRTLVANMVRGVTEGFEKNLEVQGIGYKVEKKGDRILLSMGFSHPVEFLIPSDVRIDVDKNLVKVTGIDKERVGQISASIRGIKPPDTYKGKGIRYQGEKIKLKPGKSGAK